MQSLGNRKLDKKICFCIVTDVQSVTYIMPFAIPWTAAWGSFPVLHCLPEFSQTHVHHESWCHPTISSSVTPFSSCSQSFPASGSFPVSQLLTSSGQSSRASISASVLPMNIQGWFPLGFTGLISFLSKGFSRLFSSTIVQKHECMLSH